VITTEHIRGYLDGDYDRTYSWLFVTQILHSS